MNSKSSIFYLLLLISLFLGSCESNNSEGYLGLVITEDKEKPFIKITSPSNNEEIEGTFLLSYEMADLSGIKRLELFLDDSVKINDLNLVTKKLYVNSLPYKGTHSFKIKAHDYFDNYKESGVINVNFKNRTFTKFYNATNTGVPLNNINTAILKDGVFWIGSDNGLIRFDGSTWNIYTRQNSAIINDKILSLAFDNNGVLFIGTERGLCYYKNYTFYRTEFKFLETTAIAVDSANIKWIGTFSEGLYSYNDTSFTHVYSSNPSYFPYFATVLTIERTGRNRLIVGTDGNGLYSLENNKWKEIGNSHGYTAIEEDKDGSIWIGTGYENGLHLYGNSYSFNNIPDEIRRQLYGVSDIVTDKDGSKWFVSGGNLMSGTMMGDKLVKFDGENWTVFKPDNSGLIKKIKSVIIENERIWVFGVDGIASAEY